MSLHIYRFPQAGKLRTRRFYSLHLRDRDLFTALLCIGGCALSVGMFLTSAHAVFAGAVIGALIMAVVYLISAQTYRIPPVVAEGLSKETAGGSIIIVNTVFTTIHPQQGPQTIYSVGPVTVVASTEGGNHAE